MTARDMMINKIKTAPDSLVSKAYDFILFPKQRRELQPEAAKPQATTANSAYVARRLKMFGNRFVSDSHPLLEKLRADQF